MYPGLLRYCKERRRILSAPLMPPKTTDETTSTRVATCIHGAFSSQLGLLQDCPSFDSCVHWRGDMRGNAYHPFKLRLH